MSYKTLRLNIDEHIYPQFIVDRMLELMGWGGYSVNS
jgi:hypothetical protein